MNCCSSFALPWVGKGTKIIQSFVSIIGNFDFLVTEEITQTAEEIKMRSILQSIEGISRFLQI